MSPNLKITLLGFTMAFHTCVYAESAVTHRWEKESTFWVHAFFVSIPSSEAKEATVVRRSFAKWQIFQDYEVTYCVRIDSPQVARQAIQSSQFDFLETDGTPAPCKSDVSTGDYAGL